jgi:hypothetical protein
VAAALNGASVSGQTTATGGHHDGAAEPAKTAMCAMMAAPNTTEQKSMMAKMAAADQTLEELFARMNAATGDEKVAAIAAVVAELVQQRRDMQTQMMHMHGSMTPPKPPTAVPAGDDHASHHPAK